MKLYNLNVDLAKANVYTKFGHMLSIHCQDMEQKQKFEVNQGP